eukprot:6419278-Pyramimonas_sp.AAC.1
MSALSQHLQCRTLRHRLRDRLVAWRGYACYKHWCTALALSFSCLQVLRRAFALWKEYHGMVRMKRAVCEMVMNHFRLNFLPTVFLSWQLVVGRRMMHRHYIKRAAFIRRRECLQLTLREWNARAGYKRVSRGMLLLFCRIQNPIPAAQNAPPRHDGYPTATKGRTRDIECVRHSYEP